MKPGDGRREHETEDGRAEHRGEREASVDGDLRAEGQLIGAERRQQPDAGRADSDAEQPAGRGQEHGFHGDLADEARAAGAEGAADRELARPAGRADQQQVHQIHRADHQQEEDAGLRQEHERPDRRDVVRVKRDNDRSESGTRDHRGFRIVAFEHGILRVELRLRLGDRGARLQPRDHLRRRPGVAACRPPLLGVGRQRQIDPCLGGEKPEARRQHADHRVRHAVDANRSTDHTRVAREPPPPGRVGQNGDVIGPPRHLLLGERASSRQRHAERREQVGRHTHHRLRLGRSRFAGNGGARTEDRQAAQRRQLTSPLVVIGHGRAVPLHARLGVRVVDRDEAIAVRERQRTQQHRLDDGEDGQVGAEAQRERGERRQREPRLACQMSHRVPKVSCQAVHRDLRS